MSLAELRDWPVSTRIAAIALIAALVVNVAVLVRSQGAEQTPALVIPPVTHIIARPIDDGELIRQAAQRAPFGGSPAATQMLASNAILQQTAVAPPPARPRLLGTVVESRGGGFVVVELPGARVQLVRVGERVGDLRLRSVAPGMAVFDDPHGERITLRALSPASGPESRP